MKNEIMVIQALTEMGQTVTNMLSMSQSFRSIRKRDAAIFDEKLRYLKTYLRLRGYDELFCYSMTQLESTFRKIEENKYTGEMLRISLEMLNFQYQSLRRYLEGYLQN